MKPPASIDGAEVIAYIILKEKHQNIGKTSHYVGGELVIHINGLAICRYSDSEEYYLFYCNQTWECITDTHHQTIEDAIDQAEFEFTNTETDWIFLT